MPRLDLILLPLLAGYIFLITFNYTKFSHQRIEKNRLLYNSLLVALILIAFVYLMDYFLFKKNNLRLDVCSLKSHSVKYYRDLLSSKIDDIIIFKKPGFKQSLITILISHPLALLLNRIKYFSEDFSFDYALHTLGSEFDKIIWNALGEKEDLDKLLMLTTKNNKVYIGQITKQSEPIENTHIRIIPSLSGYRNKETQEITITNNYTNIIEKLAEEDKLDRIDDKLGVIIPTSEIILISKFDYEVFGKFNPSQDIAQQPK